jgi:hypothetical protein
MESTRLGRRLTPAEVQDGMAASRLPGRLQIISRAPLVIADVAHNPATVSFAQPEDLILVTGSHYLIGPILDTVQPAETSAGP